MKIEPVEQPKGTAIERWLIDHAALFFNPRLLAWLVGTLLLGVFLYFIAGKADALGSLAVTLINVTALLILGYRASIALEGGKRPHQLFEEASAAGEVSGGEERRWQLEQLADSMLRRRFLLVAAFVLGATFLKF